MRSHRPDPFYPYILAMLNLISPGNCLGRSWRRRKHESDGYLDTFLSLHLEYNDIRCGFHPAFGWFPSWSGGQYLPKFLKQFVASFIPEYSIQTFKVSTGEVFTGSTKGLLCRKLGDISPNFRHNETSVCEIENSHRYQAAIGGLPALKSSRPALISQIP